MSKPPRKKSKKSPPSAKKKVRRVRPKRAATRNLFPAIVMSGIAAILFFFSMEERSGSSRTAENPSTLQVAYQKAKTLSFNDRIVFWSENLSHLSGEAPKLKHDLKELVSRFKIADIASIIPNKFDCTTFVETVSALARSEDPDALYQNILAIRYKDGNPSYFNRNHFPEADWIPNNRTASILADITEEIGKQGGVEVSWEKKLENRGAWFKAQRRLTPELQVGSIQASASWATPVQVRIPYIPLRDSGKVLPILPNGAVINLVHPDDGDKHPTLISHQGFVVRKGKQVYFRHATGRGEGQIHTELLETYLKKRSSEGQEIFRSWPVVGFNIVKFNPPEGS